MDLLKQVIAEWVLTTGKLPGFAERVRESRPYWNTVGSAGMTVYRAQGGEITEAVGGIPPSIIQLGVRPVLATSKSALNISRYAGSECCMFKIDLRPGTRYIDVTNKAVMADDSGMPALAIKNAVLENVLKMCPPSGEGSWPSSSTAPAAARHAILQRCTGRVKNLGRKDVEYIPPENEIMVYGLEGTLTEPTELPEPIAGRRAFEVTYAPPSNGRGRTFRRKAKRSNKNGRRSTRKSGHKWHRNP